MQVSCTIRDGPNGTSISLESSPDLRGSGSGTPLRVSTLRHQFSEGSMPHNNGNLNEAETFPHQGTVSDQRRILSAYSVPLPGYSSLLQHFLRPDQSHSTAARRGLQTRTCSFSREAEAKRQGFCFWRKQQPGSSREIFRLHKIPSQPTNLRISA
jgi:hypothetical protein